jgi:hypothetical protein
MSGLQRFSTASKYRACQAVFAIGFIATLFCMAHMSPWDASHHNKVWFGLAIVLVALTIPFALGFYYYRSKLHSVDTGLIEVQTLSRAGEQLKQEQDKTVVSSDNPENKGQTPPKPNV